MTLELLSSLCIVVILVEYLWKRCIFVSFLYEGSMIIYVRIGPQNA
jgi:hypothetical protein